MLADTVERNVSLYYESAFLGEGNVQFRVCTVAFENLLVNVGDPSWSIAQTLPLRIFSQLDKKIPDNVLDSVSVRQTLPVLERFYVIVKRVAGYLGNYAVVMFFKMPYSLSESSLGLTSFWISLTVSPVCSDILLRSSYSAFPPIIRPE
jgi:hypothetical protein